MAFIEVHTRCGDKQKLKGRHRITQQKSSLSIKLMWAFWGLTNKPMGMFQSIETLIWFKGDKHRNDNPWSLSLTGSV